MLQAVDQKSQHLSYMDPICDFLYHIKYMYTGDSVKEQVSLCSASLKIYCPNVHTVNVIPSMIHLSALL